MSQKLNNLKNNLNKEYMSVPVDSLENILETVRLQQELIYDYFLKQEKGASGEDFTPSKCKCQACEKEFYSWRDTCLSCEEVGSLTLIKMGKEEYLKRFKEIKEALLETGLYCLIEEIEYLRNENKQIKQAYDDRFDDIETLQQMYDESCEDESENRTLEDWLR